MSGDGTGRLWVVREDGRRKGGMFGWIWRTETCS